MASSALSAEEVEAAAAAAATAQQAAQTAVADAAPVAAKTLVLLKRAAASAESAGAAVEEYTAATALPLSAEVGGRVGGSASCEGRLFTQRAASTGRRACRKVCEDRCSPRRPSLKPPLGQLAAAARELAAAAAAEVDTQVAPAIEAALKQGAEEVQRAAGLAGRTTSSHRPAVNRCSGRLRRRCLADDWPCLDGGPAPPPARRHAGLLLLLLRLEVPSTLLPASLRHDDGTTTVLCDLTLADGGEQRAWGG